MSTLLGAFPFAAQIDLEHWSIRNIAKRASAWDRQQEEAKRREANKKAEAAAAAAAAEQEDAEGGADAAAAAAGGAGAGSSAGAAGPGAIGVVTLAGNGRQSSGQLQQQQQQQQAVAQRPASAAAAGGAGRPSGGAGSIAPQLRIAEDGTVIVDEESLTVQAQQNDLANFRRVDEGVSGGLSRSVLQGSSTVHFDFGFGGCKRAAGVWLYTLSCLRCRSMQRHGIDEAG
jgi:hypothetical protein